jgi:hypothetical protein
MSITAARSRFGFLVAVAVAVLPALAQPLPAAAATGGTLFAITGMNQSVLSRIDPVTGVVTAMEDLAGADQGQLVSLTGNPAAHKLYAIRSSTIFIPPTTINVKNELLTIDSQTGAFTVSPSTNVPTSAIAFDQSSGNLYGIGHQFIGGTFGLFIDRLDLATGAGTPIAPLGDVGSDILGIAIAPDLHTIYVNAESLGIGSPAGARVLTVDLQGGIPVTSSPTLLRAVRNITYDSSSHLLFGTTDDSPRDLVQIDPASGAETVAANINDGGGIFTFPMAADPSTHTVFLDIETSIDFLNFEDRIYSINDAGASPTTFSPPTGGLAWSLYFESPVAITPDSIKADVRAALASGAIDNAGVANALLAQLNAADERGPVPDHQLPIGRDPCPSVQHAAVSVSWSRSRSRSCRRHHKR